jgi:hypothetical protein
METHSNFSNPHRDFLRGYAFAQTNGGAGAGGSVGGGVGPQDLEHTGPDEDNSPGNIKTGGTEGSGIPGEPPPPDRVPGAPPQNAVE